MADIQDQINDTTTFSNLTNDPYLQFKPHFSRSLPVQLLSTGIVVTLCATLIIQLLFTWQYHWPLARLNWSLQFTAASTLFLNIVSILYVVLSALQEKSKQWPYMFEYIAVPLPRIEAWSVPEMAVWFVMEATTSALASVTHIQFLTYLYPSRLESRLVFFLLGPLAAFASVTTLLPISYYANLTASNTTSSDSDSFNGTIFNNTSSAYTYPDDREGSKQDQLRDLYDAARNICNLTLSLLFTLSLLIWGFLVNRTSAWRTDGGTAAFGVGALFLALISTGLNFLNVFVHPRFVWLPPLLWSVVLWQSFLGWWWWVGSASGIATRELSDESRRERKEVELKRAKRKRRKTIVASGTEDDISTITPSHLERWRSSMGNTLSRWRSTQPPVPNAGVGLTTFNSGTSDQTTHISPSTSSAVTPRGVSYLSQISAAFQRAWSSLRQAHVRAARVQAIEQRQIQIQIQIENGRGLGRFPGSIGGQSPPGVLLGWADASMRDGEASVREQDRAEERPPAPEGVAQEKRDDDKSRTLWWWGPLRKWRLRDSTLY